MAVVFSDIGYNGVEKKITSHGLFFSLLDPQGCSVFMRRSTLGSLDPCIATNTLRFA